MNVVDRLEAIAAAKTDPEGFYIKQVDLPHGKFFAQTVGNFQEGFLKDKVCTDLDVAFARAVETAARLLPAIMAKAA